MTHRTIGTASVFPIGLGMMPLATRDAADRAERTVHAALDAGVTLIDTADAYGPDETTVGFNERQVAAALASYAGDTSDVLVATKGGHTRTAGGGWGLNGRPEYLRAACDASLKALGVEAIGLYQYHRPDPEVPYAETMGALAELRDAGKIRMIGISNANVELIDIARSVLGDGGLASVQNELSPGTPGRPGRDPAALRRARDRVPAVEPFRRDQRGRRPRQRAAGVRRGGRGAWGEPVPGDAGLAARPGAGADPDPGCQPAGVRRQLGRRGDPGADTRRTRPPLRTCCGSNPPSQGGFEPQTS